MQSNDVYNEIGQVLSSSDGVQVLSALRQDDLVWRGLEHGDLLQAALEQCGSQPTCWNPGRLALLALKDPRTPEALRVDPLPALGPALQERVLQAFQAAKRSGKAPTSLAEAGLLALALRERRRLTGTWNGLLQEILPRQNNQSSETATAAVWSTPLACLYGLIPDPEALLQGLMPTDGLVHHALRTSLDWITHAQITQPDGEEAHIQVLERLVKAHPAAVQLGLLRSLSLRGFERLSMALAGRLLVGHPAFASLRAQVSATDLDLSSLASRALALQQMGAFYQLSGDRGQALSLYNTAEITLEQWLAGLYLQRLNLQVGPGANDSGVLMESGQVSHLASAAGWLRNDLGVVLVSHPYASSVLDQVTGESDSPFFQLERARQVFDRQPAIARDMARQGAAGLLDEIRRSGLPFDGDFVYTWQPESVLSILMKLDLLEEAQSLSAALLAIRPADRTLLDLASQIFERLSLPEKAITCAKTAAALDPNNPAWHRRLGFLYSQMSDWEASFVEWQMVLDLSDSPTAADRLACAQVALSAGRLDAVIAHGQAVLQSDVNNGVGQGLVGQALAAKGDAAQAVGYLVRATLLSPEVLPPWLVLARLQKEAGEAQRVLETLRAAVTAVPEAQEAHLALGEACADAGLLAEALPHLKKAFQLGSQADRAALSYARTLRLLGHAVEARATLEQVRHGWSGCPELAYEYALTLLDLDEPEGALPVLELALRNGLPVLDAYLLYARILLGDYHQAAEAWDADTKAVRMHQASQALQHILTIEPQNIEARFLMADILRERGDLEAALEAYREMADSPAADAPELRWRVQWGLGRTALRLFQHDIALAALKEACQLKADYLPLQRTLAEAALQAFLPQESLEAAAYAMQLAPDDLDTLAWYADFVTRAGEPRLAVEALERAAQLDPHRPDLLVALAKGQLSAGDLAAARVSLESLLALDFVSREELRRAAHVYLRLGDQPSALVCYQRALVSDTTAPTDLLFEVAQLHERMGSHDAALELVQQTLDDTPNSLPAHLLQADLLSRLNRPQAALAVLERALRIAQSMQASGNEEINPVTRTFLGEIHERFTTLMMDAGDFAAALHHAERALSMHPDDARLCFRAADLALALLQGERASRIINSFQPGENPYPAALLECGQDGLDLLCLESEIALDLNQEETIRGWVDAGLQEAPGEPRLLAAQARLLARQGDLPRAQRAFAGAWENAAERGVQWLSEAALAVERWSEARMAAGQFAQSHSNEARAQLNCARTLVLCAEYQRLCDAAGCRTNAPGKAVISEASRDAFEDAIQAAGRLANAGEIGRWQARGQAVFNPSVQSARGLAAMPAQVEDIAALVAVLRQLNNRAAAVQVSRRYADHPQVLLQLALCYLDNSSSEGLAVAERAVAANPNLPLARVILGQQLQQNGELVTALDQYENALSIWPEEPEWHDIAGDLCQQIGNTASGLLHRKQALHLNPNSAELAFKLGQNCLAEEDAAGAISYLENAVALDANHASAWLALAGAYHLAGRLPQALDAARKASELNPTSADGLLSAGETALSMNQIDQALEFAQGAVRREPENSAAVLLLSSVLVLQDRAEDGLNIIEQAPPAVKAVFEVAFERARLIHQLYGAQQAVEVLEKLVKDYPEAPDLLAFLARAQAECGEFKSAERYAFKALRLDPNRPDLTLMLGRLQRKTGQLDQAVHLLSEAIRMEPTNLEAYLELGSVLQERREYAQAMQIYQQAMRIAPNDYQAFYQCGLILRDSKDYSGAESLLRRAADLVPDNLTIRRQLVAVIALNLVHHKQEVALP